jgi:NAD(P)-dependent dehydrogenase (short-subunit alcohol dehydrogenase family)
MPSSFGPNGWTPDAISSLNGKVYLITGATAGTGFEAARLLLRKGAEVVMLNRNPAKSETALATLRGEIPDAKVSTITLDLSSLASVRDAAATVLARVPVVSALLCNAAIAQVSSRQLTADGFESQIGVNFFGHFLLCALLGERIEESGGRIVIVGSAGYKMVDGLTLDDLTFEHTYSSNDVYCQSKLAQMMFGFELQRRLEAAGRRSRVYVCHPGASRTALIDNATWSKRLMWSAMSVFAQSAERGAWPEVLCATEANLKGETLYGPTQRWETVGAVGECVLAPHALDREAATKLWQVAEQSVGCVYNV